MKKFVNNNNKQINSGYNEMFIFSQKSIFKSGNKPI